MDWDVPDTDMARALAIKVLPGTRPYLIVQYRESMRSFRKFGTASDRHRRYRHVMTTVETGVCTIRPPGPLGAVIVRLKPEAVAFLVGECLQCFADAKIDLGDVFGAQKIMQLEEMVSQAPSSYERVCTVARFLSALGCPREPDAVVCQAAACLRSNPSLQIGRLAAKMDVSERQLLRKFQTTFGVNPKHFARLARIEKVLASRNGGSCWADIAYRCGFADQAHMIGDFNAVLGVSPKRALMPASAELRQEINVPNDGGLISHDYFVW
ncbi:helix-turn-helix domain-containing protein [Bradyrhizobium cenepequi]